MYVDQWTFKSKVRMSILSLSLMITQDTDTYTWCTISLKFKVEAEKQLGVYIKQHRSNRGVEYLFGKFKSFLTQEGIVSQLSAPRTPQQNGVVERINITLLNIVRSMLSYSSLLVSFWEDSLETAMYLLNLVPSKSVRKTPSKLWKRCKPSLNRIQI